MKKEKLVLAISISIFALILILLFLVIGLDYVKNAKTYLIIARIIAILYFIVSIFTIITLFKFLKFFSILLILINSVCSLGFVYFIPIRLYYKILVLVTVISIIYSAILIIARITKKVYKLTNVDVLLLNAVLPLLFIGSSCFIKTFNLFDLIEIHPDNAMNISMIIGLISALIFTTLYIFFNRDRTNKKEYFAKMAGILFGSLILVMFTVYGSIDNINYGFDKSVSSEEYYIIVDKYHTHSYKSRTGHYLVLVIDDKEYNLHVNRLIYSQYNIGEKILLNKYNGALGYLYYEYCINEIFIYDE